MEFRGHFFLVFLIDIMWYAVQISVFEVVFTYTEVLGGLERQELYVFLSVLFITDALNMMFVSQNFWRFPSLIATGDLDFILLKPVSTTFLALFRYFNVGSVLNFLTSASLLVWSLYHYTGSIHVLNALLFIVLIICSELLMIAFQLLICTVSIRLINANGIQQLYYSLDTLAAKPDTIYPQQFRSILLTWFPMALLASVPTFTLLGKVSLASSLLAIVITALFFSVSVLLFRYNLRAYSGASS